MRYTPNDVLAVVAIIPHRRSAAWTEQSWLARDNDDQAQGSLCAYFT